MRREAQEKERNSVEAGRLRRENRQMAVEIEGMKETMANAVAERDRLREVVAEYEGIKEQLIEADKTMAEQHEMIIQLQGDVQVLS